MDLSIIIPVYNAALLIDRCLDSILNQTTTYSYEVIMVDDGSTDDSTAHIEARHHPNITLLRQENAGPAAARNRGLAAAHGKYCAFLDADDYWLPGYIDKTVDFMETHPQCVAVSVAQRHITMSGESISPRCYVEYNAPFVIDDFFTFWAKYKHVCTGSAVMLREMLNALGGQREDMRTCCEDLELWFLISTYGQWGFIPEILFVSDGNAVTRQQGWLNKMKPRWMNTLTIDEWQRRIIAHLDLSLPEGYIEARGVIARQLAYGLLLSDRVEQSLQHARTYGDYFPSDPISRLMKVARHNRWTWHVLAKMLKYREYHRK